MVTGLSERSQALECILRSDGPVRAACGNDAKGGLSGLLEVGSSARSVFLGCLAVTVAWGKTGRQRVVLRIRRDLRHHARPREYKAVTMRGMERIHAITKAVSTTAITTDSASVRGWRIRPWGTSEWREVAHRCRAGSIVSARGDSSGWVGGTHRACGRRRSWVEGDGPGRAGHCSLPGGLAARGTPPSVCIGMRRILFSARICRRCHGIRSSSSAAGPGRSPRRGRESRVAVLLQALVRCAFFGAMQMVLPLHTSRGRLNTTRPPGCKIRQPRRRACKTVTRVLLQLS